jgi:DNA-binding transcriptional MerR regulator
MRIGELAREAGVSVDTVRFYERRGVLPAPQRRASGYRVYTPASAGRIKLAKSLQALGFTLDEVVAALGAWDTGTATCEGETWRLESVLARLDARIAELLAVRGDVESVLRSCREGACGIAHLHAGS